MNDAGQSATKLLDRLKKKAEELEKEYKGSVFTPALQQQLEARCGLGSLVVIPWRGGVTADFEMARMRVYLDEGNAVSGIRHG